MDDSRDDSVPVQAEDGSADAEDIEAAYLRALAALDSAENEGPAAFPTTAQPDADIVPEAEVVESADDESTPTEYRPDPRQIVEATLFVGGEPLTVKRLMALLGSGIDQNDVEHLVDSLNQEYDADHRPYEIRLAEGGYRLVLKPEYERIRSQVFNQGPRDVRLSREAIEVLALVAYYQPLDKRRVEEAGVRNAGTILRQLLRRDLIDMERIGPREHRYSTTQRFLQLMGIGSLDELPRPEDFEMK